MLYFGDWLTFNASRRYIYLSIFFYILIVKYQKALKELNYSDVRPVLVVPLGIT